MQIHGLQTPQAAQSIQRTSNTPSAGTVEASPSVSATSGDELDLSAEAQQLSLTQSVGQVQESSEIRTEKVAAIRQAIADGTYETPEKLSSALDSLLDTFA